jgi:hypothetical protein
MDIPEHVRGDGIKSHRLGHLHSLAPILARYTRIVDLAGNDLERLVIKLKVVPHDLKRMLPSLGDGLGRQHVE